MNDQQAMIGRFRDSVRDRLSFSTRRRIAAGRVRLRQPTAQWRALPAALIIGTQRGGTSSLYRYLGAHPQAVASLRKEVEFFTRRYQRGEGWYRAHFPLRPTTRIAFEADPYYLFHPLAPARAADLVPDARIVVLLRDPAFRALSHWRHNRRLGVEPLGFADALAAEPERLRGEEERIVANPGYDSFNHSMLSYVARGRYAPQLLRWMGSYRREQLLVLRSEDFYTDTPATFDRVVVFLGLDPWRPQAFANWSYRGQPAPTGRGPEADSMEGLRRRFAPDNERIAELLGWDPQWS